jgi:hypothetical protein
MIGEQAVPHISSAICTTLVRKTKHDSEQSFIERFEIGFKGITLLQTVLKRVTLKML